MSRQLEISFSYDVRSDNESAVPRMRRDVDWAARLDDLFTGISNDDNADVSLKSGIRDGSSLARSAATKPSI